MATQDVKSQSERLAVLLGRWRTRERTTATADAPAIEVDAIDTYEWLHGRAGASAPRRRAPVAVRPWMDITLTRERS